MHVCKRNAIKRGAEREKAMQVRKLDRGSDTPWGRAQDVREVADGITLVTTAGHGGLYVTRPMPADARAYAAAWSHGWGARWYEEDCAVGFVIAEYPHAFAALGWTIDAAAFAAWREKAVLS